MSEDLNTVRTAAETNDAARAAPSGLQDALGYGDGTGGRDAQASRDSRPTIEQRYEIETTLVGLGLEDDEVGVPIGLHERYVLRKLIGRGSMGAVFLAEDVELQRRVAIKVVARRIESERQGLRLRREARALASLDHRNVLKVFDLGTDGEELFIAMEHVAGANLREWQKDRPFGEVFEAYLQAGRGLAAAHDRGLVHRDFKPDNVLVDEEERGRLRVRVGDFGLVGGEVDARAVTEPKALRGLLTSSNTLLGTLPYMAPEQLRREPADARSDQHQFCVALWEATAGERPFGPSGRPLEGDTSVPARPTRMPRWAYAVLRRGLAFAREGRYPSMHALLAALEHARRGRRALAWVASTGFVACMAAVGWCMQPGPCEGTDQRMAGIWTPAVRESIATSLRGRSAAEGGDTSEYVVGGLDRATARWSDENHQLCEARARASASERAELDVRQECLDRWAHQIEQRIERLRRLESSDVANAFELVAPLEHVGDSCTMPLIPIDPSVADSIERAEQAELLRNLDDALRFAHEAVAVAHERSKPCESDDPEGPMRSSELAAALFRLGHVQSERRESKAALVTLVEAHLNAYACGDEHRDADAMIHAAKVRALDFHDVGEAGVELEEARVALRRVKEPRSSLRWYDERMAAGSVAETAGDYEAARLHAEQGIEALGEPADPVRRAKLEANIGNAFNMEARFAEAAEAYARATASVTVALGEQHPRSRLYAAREALNLGLAAQQTSNHAVMRRRFAEAIAAGEPSITIKALAAWAQGEVDANDGIAAAEKTRELLAFLDEHPDDVAPVVRALVESTAGQILAWLRDPKGVEVLARACARWHELEHENATKCEEDLAQARRDAESPASP